MAINIVVLPKLFVPTGLSLVNPATVILEATAGETFGVVEILDKADNVLATHRISFYNDANSGLRIAYLDISQTLKTLMNSRIVPSPLRQTLSVGTVIIDETNYFLEYKIRVGTEVHTRFAIYAGLDGYNLFYFNNHGNLPNLQSDFRLHVLLPDDFGVPTLELVDFDEADFDENDFV